MKPKRIKRQIAKQLTLRQIVKQAIVSEKILSLYQKQKKRRLYYIQKYNDIFLKQPIIKINDNYKKPIRFPSVKIKKNIGIMIQERKLQYLFWVIKKSMDDCINLSTDINVLMNQLGPYLYSILCGQDKGKLNRQAAEIFVKNFRVCIDQQSKLEQAKLFITKLKEKQNYITEQEFIELLKKNGLSRKQLQMISINQVKKFKREKQKKALQIKNNKLKKVSTLKYSNRKVLK